MQKHKNMKDLTPEVYVGDDVFEQVDVLDGQGKQLFLIWSECLLSGEINQFPTNFY